MWRESGCIGKQPLSKQLAQEIAKRSRRAKGKCVQPYRCSFCGQWHVGQSNRK